MTIIKNWLTYFNLKVKCLLSRFYPFVDKVTLKREKDGDYSVFLVHIYFKSSIPKEEYKIYDWFMNKKLNNVVVDCSKVNQEYIYHYLNH